MDNNNNHSLARGSVTLGANALEILGTTTYSGNPLVVLTRELLQNSIDTCNERRGRDGDNYAPKISITIDKLEEHRARIICLDNGMGMSVEDILYKYLVIGAGSKANRDTVGKFGFAKMSTITNPEWRIDTRDLYLSNKTVNEDGTIEILRSNEFLDGTRVTVLCRGSVYGHHLETALWMIYLSDTHGIPVEILVNAINSPGKPTVVFEDTWHGLDRYLAGNFIKFSVDPECDQDDFRLTVTGAFEKIGMFTNTHGLNAVRLKGLVQFMRSNSNERETNLILDVDVASDIAPTDERYPFSLSRESLRGNKYWQVDNHFRRHDIDNLQSKQLLTAEPERQTISGDINGRAITGKRGKSSHYSLDGDLIERLERLLESDAKAIQTRMSDLVEFAEELEVDGRSFRMPDESDMPMDMMLLGNVIYDPSQSINDIASRFEWRLNEGDKVFIGEDDLQRFGTAKLSDIIGAMINMGAIPVVAFDDPEDVIVAAARRVKDLPFDFTVVFDEYEKPSNSKNLKRHAKIIALWRIVVELVSNEDNVAIGVFTHSNERARYSSTHRQTEYSINPSLFVEDLAKLPGNAFLMYLWNVACHEAAHARYSSHNEAFESERLDIVRQTSSALYYAMKSIKL